MSKWLIFLYIFCSVHSASAKSWESYLFEIQQGPNSSIHNCSELTPHNVCADIVEKYQKKKKDLWNLLRDPVAFGFKSPMDIEYEEKASELEIDLINIGSECLKAQYKNCYPHLKNQIDLSNLSSLFERLKSDARFRMNEPAVFCYDRAKLLAKTLAEFGYDSEELMIQKAPVLIAPLLDANDNYRNKYIDYHGTHHVILIKVAPDSREYILDPQFAETPLPKEEYFRLTIGENCENASKPSKPWGCNYQTHHPTWERPFLETFRPSRSENSKGEDYIETVISGDEDKAKCGFIPLSPDRFSQKNRPELMTVSNKISEQIRSKFIIAGIESNYHQELNMLKYYEKTLIQLQSDPYNQNLIPNTKNQLEATKAKISNYEKHIKNVCANLKVSKKTCSQIRVDHKKYLLQIQD